MFDFNRALLAKLGWFLMTRPEAFQVKTLYARYLQRSNLLDVAKQAYSSFFWKGILATRDLLRKGLIFVIGNGSRVQTQIDLWIPNIPLFQAILASLAVSRDEFTCVQALFLPSSHLWNRSLILSLFSPECARHILSIQPFAQTQVDTLSWKLENDGNFSVHSAYHLDQANRTHGSTFGTAFNWKKLWSFKLQARLKLLLWKLAARAMMVRG